LSSGGSEQHPPEVPPPSLPHKACLPEIRPPLPTLEDDDFRDTDSITDLFETIIDPNRIRPDRSKLKLELIHTYSPLGFDRRAAGTAALHGHDRLPVNDGQKGGWGIPLSMPLTPDGVESDGIDFIGKYFFKSCLNQTLCCTKMRYCLSFCFPSFFTFKHGQKPTS